MVQDGSDFGLTENQGKRVTERSLTPNDSITENSFRRSVYFVFSQFSVLKDCQYRYCCF